MPAYQMVHCPNCGSPAERHRCPEQRVTRTQCSHCDYLLITCTESGRVIEAYAPGLYTHQLKTSIQGQANASPLALGSSQLSAGRRRF